MATFYSPRIVTDGLVFHMDAGNVRSYTGTGTVLSDLSGNRYNGTLYNGPTFANGVMSFDGTNDYMQADISTTALDGDPTFSVDMFVRRRSGTNIAAGSGFWGIGGTGQGNSVEGWTPTANVIHLDFYDSTRIQSSNTYPEGSFVHIVWTKNGAGAETTNIKCYVNGVEVGLSKTRNATRTNQLNTSIAGKGICVGRINGDATYGIAPIDVGTFKVYSTALTADQVRQNYHATKGRFGLL